MDKFPLLWKGAPVGELTTEREALYTWFSACCRLPAEGLWCVWGVGEAGELRLGVLEPHGIQGTLCRRFSHRMTGPAGQLLRGELRPVRAAENWEAVSAPEALFHTPWLRRELRTIRGAQFCREGERRRLAVPYDPRRPFPLAAIFCLASVRQIGEQWYVLYTFDRQEWPVL